MSKQMNAKVECRMVGDYFDEAERPLNFQGGIGKSDAATLLADYQDDWAASETLRDFTVLLKDGRMIDVKGHRLTHEPHPVPGQDVFGVLVRQSDADQFVAYFKSAEIAGIFHGKLRVDHTIAS